MDKLNLFPRADNLKPFVLLDGHGSRFDLELVKYIRDKEHLWSICIGLPYGTHIWQVGDSAQQNGNFKHYQNIMKQKIMQEKKANNVTTVFSPTDIVPIINFAWDRSFARTESNKTAIVERGWNPLNYALLTSAEVLLTKNANVKEVTQTIKQENESENESLIPSVLKETLSDQVSFDDGAAADAIDTIVQGSLKRIHQQKITRKKNTERLDKTKKLTSGVAFHRGCVGLHSDTVFNNLTDYEGHKKNTIKEKKRKTKIALQNQINAINAIRSKPEEKWTVAEIKRLLTYKKGSNDLPIKNAGTNRTTLMAMWNERRTNPSPSCSPYNSDNEEDKGDADDNDLEFIFVGKMEGGVTEI